MHDARPVTARTRRTSGLVPCLALAALLLVTMATALAIGSVNVPIGTVLEVVARRTGLVDTDVSLLQDRIVWQLRLPRVVGAASVGAGLAVVGAVLQSLTRNDLADPYLLGISSGAAVGAVCVLVLGVGAGTVASNVSLTLGAFLGALGALVLVLALAAGRSGVLPPSRTVLAGVVVGQLCAAFTSFVVLSSGDGQAPRRVMSWTLGSVAGVRWGTALLLLAVSVAALVLVLAFARQLDAFAFGEAAARSLGVPIERTRWILMVGTALVTACLVAYSGAIGFVGLVVPHVVRLLVGSAHALVLPLSALAGAILLVASDLVARSALENQEVPVGIVTAVVGAPFLAWLLRREARAT